MFPADASPGVAVWCMNAKHGTPGTQVCTARHDQGMRWQARWVAEGQERSKSFAKKADAEAKVREVTSDVHTGAYVDRRKSSAAFRTVAEEWYTAKQAKCTPSTLSGYRSVLDSTVLPRWGDVRLSDITHADVQQWVTWMTTSKDARQPKSSKSEINDKRAPLSARSAVSATGLVKQILDYAIRTKRLASNPTNGLELPRVVAKRDRALTVDEVAALVAAAEGGTGPILQALAYTGCRFSELAALRVGDVDIERRRIMVDKGVTVARRKLAHGNTKTHQSRSIPILTSALVDTLEKVTAGRAPDEYLFPEPNGGPMRNWYLRNRFDKACATAGLTGITLKSLRHTAGSLAISVGGASVVAAQRLLGHKDATTTLRVYSHLLPDDFDNLTAAMDRATTR